MADGIHISLGEPLTPYENELVQNFIEEAAEAIQGCTKLQRFGRETRPDNNVPNTQHLGFEVGNLAHMISELLRIGIIDPNDVAEGAALKKDRLRRFMQHKEPVKKEPVK